MKITTAYWINVSLSAINFGLAFGLPFDWVTPFNFGIGLWCAYVAYRLHKIMRDNQDDQS